MVGKGLGEGRTEETRVGERGRLEGLHGKGGGNWEGLTVMNLFDDDKLFGDSTRRFAPRPSATSRVSLTEQRIGLRME